MRVHEIQTPFTPAGSGVPRSHNPGEVHLTAVMRFIDGTLKLGAYGKGGAKAWNLDIAAEVGFIWEDVLTAAFASRHAVRLEEQRLGPIVLSPDGFGQDPGLWDYMREEWVVEPSDLPVLEEYKCTWMSVNQHPLNIWRYKVQGQGYLYALGLNIIVYKILHLNGDYRGSGPLYREVRIEYDTDEDKEELAANWAMLEHHANIMLEGGYDGNFTTGAS